MAGLPGFASCLCERDHCLGAGCQWWKLLDISHSEPLFSNIVANMEMTTLQEVHHHHHYFFCWGGGGWRLVEWVG